MSFPERKALGCIRRNIAGRHSVLFKFGEGRWKKIAREGKGKVSLKMASMEEKKQSADASVGGAIKKEMSQEEIEAGWAAFRQEEERCRALMEEEMGKRSKLSAEGFEEAFKVVQGDKLRGKVARRQVASLLKTYREQAVEGSRGRGSPRGHGPRTHPAPKGAGQVQEVGGKERKEKAQTTTPWQPWPAPAT